MSEQFTLTVHFIQVVRGPDCFCVPGLYEVYSTTSSPGAPKRGTRGTLPVLKAFYPLTRFILNASYCSDYFTGQYYKIEGVSK